MRLRVVPTVSLLLGTCLVALLAYGVLAKSTSKSIDNGIGAGRPMLAPGFSLPPLKPPIPLAASDGVRKFTAAAEDGTVNLTELRGTPIVLNIWASWCDPCQKEAPTLRRGWASARNAGVLFLGLDIQDTPSDAQAFIEGFRLTYPSVRDKGRDVISRYGATGIPETYFISRPGTVVAHVPGVITAGQLARGVDAARRGVAVRL